MTNSNTQDVIEHMELHGHFEETAPNDNDIQEAVFNEMTGIWTRLSHRNRVWDDVVTNRGTEKLQWYVKSLETAASKAKKDTLKDESRAKKYQGPRPIGTELDNLAREEALDNLAVSATYFAECDVAFLQALAVYQDITGEEWLRPADFNNETTTVIVTEEQQAALTGIPVATRKAMERYK